MGQVRKIVWDNTKDLKFDATRVLKDYSYAVEVSAKVLNHYKTLYSKIEVNWFTRYHSGTPQLRIIYMASLKRGLAKINNFIEISSVPKGQVKYVVSKAN